MTFLDVKTDYAFKKVFGSNENKPLLIRFLNSVIIFTHNAKIKDLIICQANSKTGQFLVQKCYSLKLKPAPI